MNNNQNRGFLGIGSDDNEDPRKVGFSSFVKSFLCPSIKLLSFTTIICTVDIILFIVTVSLGIEKDPNVLLAPLNQTLDNFGMKNPIKEQNGQVWRFITYSFLHANFMHLFTNLVSQLIIVSMFESIIGWWKCIILYLATGIGGCLFSSLVAPNINGVGASVAIFGFISAFIGFTLMNWKALDELYKSPTAKFMSLLFLLFFVLINLLIGLTTSNVDNFGHLGGLIYGFFLIWLIQSPYKEDDGLCLNNKIWFWISIVMTALLYILLGALFFFVISI